LLVRLQFRWSLSGGTWKQQIGLVAVYQDEINAYQAELDYLQPVLAALKPACSAGWKGEITSSFAISTSQSDSMSPNETWSASQEQHNNLQPQQSR
jgi:hypothetical protein